MLTVYQLETLTCPSCVSKIEKTLKKQKGVNSVEVLFNASKAKVDYDETIVNSEELRKIIKRLGYDVLSQK